MKEVSGTKQPNLFFHSISEGAHKPPYPGTSSVMNEKKFKVSNNLAYSAVASVMNEKSFKGSHKPTYPAIASMMNENGLRYQTT